MGQAAGGYDKAFVAGLTLSGMVDTRIGAGSGAVEINLGDVKGSGDSWQDYSSSFVATRSGDALLTWLMASDAVLKLARIDLGSETAGAVDPPAPAPTPTPTPTPTLTPTPAPTPAPAPSPTAHGGGGSGGGSIGWFEVTLLGLGLGAAQRLRRRKAVPPRVA